MGNLPIDPVTGKVILPKSVTDMIEHILAEYLVIAGPKRSLIIGTARQGNHGDEDTRYYWLQADQIPAHGIWGDIHVHVGGPYRNAILTVLRKRAHQTVPAVPFYPQSQHPERIFPRGSGGRTTWFYREPNNGTSELIRAGDGHIVNAHVMQVKGQDRYLGLAGATGKHLAVVGALHLPGGDPAYGGVGDKATNLLIPAAPGDTVSVVYVVKMEAHYDVRGLTLRRPARPSLPSEILPHTTLIERQFFPYELPDGQVIVLHIPEH